MNNSNLLYVQLWLLNNCSAQGGKIEGQHNSINYSDNYNIAINWNDNLIANNWMILKNAKNIATIWSFEK